MNIETPLTYILNDVNTVNRTATLRVKEEGKRNIVFRDLSISGQLASRIQLYRDNVPTRSGAKRQKLEEVEFTSTCASPSFNDNPLKLIKFIKDEGPEFHVQLVHDKGRKVFEYKNAAQKMVEKVIYLRWQASQYLRYYEVNLTTNK